MYSMKTVITGGPCCGKTTLIREFRKMGFNVLSETAREIISDTNERAWSSELQMQIFKKQLEKEMGIKNQNRKTFLDRSLIDSIAYFYVFNNSIPKIPEEILKYNLAGKYDFVFVLDRLNLVHDGLRIEKDDKEAEKVHMAIIKTYRERGYKLISVPVMSVKKRAEFILNKIKFQ